MSSVKRPTNPLEFPEDWESIWSCDNKEDTGKLTVTSGPLLVFSIHGMGTNIRRYLSDASRLFEQQYRALYEAESCIHFMFCEIDQPEVSVADRRRFERIFKEVFVEYPLVHPPDSSIFIDLAEKAYDPPYNASYNDAIAVTIFL